MGQVTRLSKNRRANALKSLHVSLSFGELQKHSPGTIVRVFYETCDSRGIVDKVRREGKVLREVMEDLHYFAENGVVRKGQEK